MSTDQQTPDDDSAHERFPLRVYASGEGRLRFEWINWSRLVADPRIQHALARAKPSVLEFDFSKLDFLNGDGLVPLLALGEYLHRERGHLTTAILPISPALQQYLLALGFLDYQRYSLRAVGLVSADPVPERGRLEGLRARIMRVSPTSVYGIQREIDRRFGSREFLATLDLGELSEARFEYATDLAIAVHELLRNIVQHSQTGRGYVAFEKVGNFALRLTIADWGLGVERSFVSGRSFLASDRVIQAILHRFHYPERPGIFTVIGTIARWGGDFILRTGSTEVHFKSKRRVNVDDEELAAEVRRLVPRSVAFFPGVQYRVEYRIPGRG